MRPQRDPRPSSLRIVCGCDLAMGVVQILEHSQVNSTRVRGTCCHELQAIMAGPEGTQ